MRCKRSKFFRLCSALLDGRDSDMSRRSLESTRVVTFDRKFLMLPPITFPWFALAASCCSSITKRWNWYFDLYHYLVRMLSYDLHDSIQKSHHVESSNAAAAGAAQADVEQAALYEGKLLRRQTRLTQVSRFRSHTDHYIVHATSIHRDSWETAHTGFRTDPQKT